MLGLIEKDLRLTFARKQSILYFLILPLFIGLSRDGRFMVGYLTILATILSAGTISYDEMDNGLAFLMTLPFDRKTYVREKYLFSFMLSAAAWCAGAILYCAGNLFRQHVLFLNGELPVLAALIPALYLSAAIIIPLRLKYGQEKSSIVLIVIYGVGVTLIFGAKRIFSGLQSIFPGAEKLLRSMPSAAILLLLTAGCALAAFVSYLWSVRIMEKKEF